MADLSVQLSDSQFVERSLNAVRARARHEFELPPGICTKIEFAMHVGVYLSTKRVEPHWRDIADLFGCSRATAARYLSAFRKVYRTIRSRGDRHGAL